MSMVSRRQVLFGQSIHIDESPLVFSSANLTYGETMSMVCNKWKGGCLTIGPLLGGRLIPIDPSIMPCFIGHWSGNTRAFPLRL